MEKIVLLFINIYKPEKTVKFGSMLRGEKCFSFFKSFSVQYFKSLYKWPW